MGLAALVATARRVVPGRRGARTHLGELVALSEAEARVVDAIAARLVAADDAPGSPPFPTPAETRVVEAVDKAIATLRPSVRRDVFALLAWVEHLAPFTRGHLRPFTELAPHEQDALLAGMATSALGDLRAGFEGLKSLVAMGHYRDPRVWAAIGYDGPLVPRGAAGGR